MQSRRPRDFDLELIDVIEHCQREHLALQLSDVDHLIDQAYRPLLDAFQAVRTSGDRARLLAIRQQMSAALEQAGVSATRELFVALNAKLLRASSDHDSDRLIANLAQRWRAEEERIGCAIDLRVMAVAAQRIPKIEAQVQQGLQRIGGDEALVDET